MVALIQYGGRITDDFDQLLMETYAEKYFTPACLQTQYQLFKDDKTGFSYTVPDGLEIEVFRNIIEGLPATDSPEIFGLHPNADLTFRTI